MPGSLEKDVTGSIGLAVRCSEALDKGLRKLRDTVAAREWDQVEIIRAEMLAAVDGYVDHYVAAGRRVEYERRHAG